MEEENILDVSKTIVLFDLHVDGHMLPKGVGHAGIKYAAKTRLKELD